MTLQKSSIFQKLTFTRQVGCCRNASCRGKGTERVHRKDQTQPNCPREKLVHFGGHRPTAGPRREPGKCISWIQSRNMASVSLSSPGSDRCGGHAGRGSVYDQWHVHGPTTRITGSVASCDRGRLIDSESAGVSFRLECHGNERARFGRSDIYWLLNVSLGC